MKCMCALFYVVISIISTTSQIIVFYISSYYKYTYFIFKSYKYIFIKKIKFHVNIKIGRKY